MPIKTGDLVYLPGLRKNDDLWKSMEKEMGDAFSFGYINDIFAHNQLIVAKNQMAQQYANQYNQNMLGQLGQGAGLGNVLSGGSTWDDYAKKYYQTKKDMSLMPAPKVNREPENEAWLDSKIAEVSFVL